MQNEYNPNLTAPKRTAHASLWFVFMIRFPLSRLRDPARDRAAFAQNSKTAFRRAALSESHQHFVQTLYSWLTKSSTSIGRFTARRGKVRRSVRTQEDGRSRGARDQTFA